MNLQGDPSFHLLLGYRIEVQLRFDWSFTHLIAPVVMTTSIILSSDKIRNEDILVLANPGPPGKICVKCILFFFLCVL